MAATVRLSLAGNCSTAFNDKSNFLTRRAWTICTAMAACSAVCSPRNLNVRCRRCAGTWLELVSFNRCWQMSSRSWFTVSVSVRAINSRTGSPNQSPQYIQPEVQVSRTSILLSRGSIGFNRAQIHLAIFSLVGFSSPSISLR